MNDLDAAIRKATQNPVRARLFGDFRKEQERDERGRFAGSDGGGDDAEPSTERV